MFDISQISKLSLWPYETAKSTDISFFPRVGPLLGQSPNHQPSVLHTEPAKAFREKETAGHPLTSLVLDFTNLCLDRSLTPLNTLFYSIFSFFFFNVLGQRVVIPKLLKYIQKLITFRHGSAKDSNLSLQNWDVWFGAYQSLH